MVLVIVLLVSLTLKESGSVGIFTEASIDQKGAKQSLYWPLDAGSLNESHPLKPLNINKKYLQLGK